jgi:hypothetical protein
MSSEQDQIRSMAERIARRISQGGGETGERNASAGGLGEELAAMRASLSELQRRLSHIESHITHEENDSDGEERRAAPHQEPISIQGRESALRASPAAVHSPWLSGMYVPATHPSQERFGVEEAAVSELVDFFEKEKACSIEPGGKPCDHCAMCSTRGF